MFKVCSCLSKASLHRPLLRTRFAILLVNSVFPTVGAAVVVVEEEVGSGVEDEEVVGAAVFEVV